MASSNGKDISMAVDDTKLEGALDWLKDHSSLAAKARAERVYLEEWLPSLRAQLAAKAIEAGSSAAAADVAAKSHPDYQIALKGYREAVERDEKYRWERTRADAVIEVWRSHQATARAMGKVQ